MSFSDLTRFFNIIGRIISGYVTIMDSVVISSDYNVTMWTFQLALVMISAFIGVFFVIAKR